LVEVVGPKLRDDTTTWYPITPPDGEYHWLPKEALGTASPLSPPPVFVKSGNPPPAADPGTKTPGSLTSLGSKLSDPAQHAQWNKAEQAERTGDYAQAEKLYTLIYQDLRQKNADPELLLVCYNRIIKCQDRLRLEGNRRSNSTNIDDGSKPAAALQPPTGKDTGGVAGAAWPNDTKSGGGQQWSGAGNLRRAPFTIDGKQAYALENGRGQVAYYLTAGGGVTLDSYVNKQVDLLGALQVRGDVRGAQFMVVSQVNLVK
jgi:hypothetical protein